ncbi:hypothetical protein [Legionella jamestowniensis]|uniref:Uncharacterized protein n=1 Tax=Legionella jamestowniensis TaxID=455 RepID=A0A0W0UGT0_9GAMM|nr:hypothetical protein [Legionella jamestowniensis]KTD07034.1 hypothetical protein Ljam_1229 [Legionella jamestowniensis]SFM03457.1 hypothetical protein SAMN02746073_0052 [Legionella jamestowniensis DSM 19215]
MSKLLKSHEKIYNNYQEFTQTNNPKFLLNSIEEFEKISAEEDIAKLLNRSTVSNLNEYSKILTLIAQSYIDYAFAQREQLAFKDAQNYLSKADECYDLIIKTVAKIPPSNLGELSDSNTEAIFYSHKIDFLKAQMKLFFIKKAMQGNYSAEKINAALKSTVRACDTFEGILRRQYRNRSYEIFGVNDALYGSIEQERNEATALLSEIRATKKTPENKSHSSPKSKSSQRKKRRLEESEEKPDTGAQESTETLISTNAPQPVIIAPPIVLTEDIVPAPMDESGLELLSTTALSFFSSMKGNETSEKSQPPRPPSRNLNTFWTPSANPISDSKRCLELINAWHSYFSSSNSHGAQQRTSALVLEKFGQTLLLAALELQQKSTIFGEKKINPALRLAIPIFFKCAQLTVNRNPYDNLRGLSMKYADLLASFVPASLVEVIEPYEYLERIHKTLSREPSLIHTLNASVEDLVQSVFNALAENCSYQDYQTVNESCCNTFKEATLQLERDRQFN